MRNKLFLAFITIFLISCTQEEVNNSFLEGTKWYEMTPYEVQYVPQSWFEFSKSTFVFKDASNTYEGSYVLSSLDNTITLAFKNALDKPTEAFIEQAYNDTVIIYDGVTYINKAPTYYTLRKQEDSLITAYINRNNLNILEEEPSDDYLWGEKDYYRVQGYDNFFFHLIKRGKGTPIVANDLVVARYKKFGLIENPDTISNWTTQDQATPVQFHYMNTSECDIISWHLAIRLMKYSDSQCEIIVPSKLGFSEDAVSVLPYVYDLKVKVKQ